MTETDDQQPRLFDDGHCCRNCAHAHPTEPATCCFCTEVGVGDHTSVMPLDHTCELWARARWELS